MPRTTRLGPFRLLRCIGEGGMGEVWEAQHVEGALVAVKVMTAAVAREAAVRSSFRLEAAAVARLDHPGIVMILDHGEVDARTAQRSGGVLAEGSPYLAMELASGGSLSQLRTALSWAELRAVLLTLLDALGHAHASGVVHRDIKPANILLCTRTDQRPGLKLTDFGISQAVDEVRHTLGSGVAGTPRYMAPEQLVGRWRDCGPWTDLYALGCICHRLCHGRPIFPDVNGPDLVRAHLREDPPPLRPGRPVPDGFQDWVDHLLGKEPRDRFQRAADAAWALRRLPDVPHDGLQSAAGALQEVILAHVGTTGTFDAPDADRDDTTVIDATPMAVGYVSPRAPHASRVVPPVPTTWRGPVVPEPSVQLLGAGLSLFGLRTQRLLGRHRERDLLWSTLRELSVTGGASLVVLRGAAGTGKSRLARWLCVRAHEVGAAHILWARCTTDAGPYGTLRDMMSRYLRSGGLWRGQVLERVAEFFDSGSGADAPPATDQEIERLTELVCPAGADDGSAERRPIGSLGEACGVVLGVVERLAAERPVLVFLDDVHQGLEGLALARHLLGRARHPVLVVLALRDEAITERSEFEQGLEALIADPRHRVVRLRPLPPAEHEALVREILRLEHSLAARVAERTAGNPLFAMELVRHWVDRGVLEVSEQGFRLREGESEEFPDELHAGWSERVDRLLAGLPGSARVYLERAAVLGAELDVEEWHEACDDPQGLRRSASGAPGRVALTRDGVQCRYALLDALLRHRLVIEIQDRLVFAHGMLRESLMRVAREAGRWGAHHRACVSVLERRRKEGYDVAPERLGYHLVEAGEPEAALDHLFQGIAARKSVGYALALSLVARCAGTMAEAGIHRGDVRWETLRVEEGELLTRLGRYDEARRTLQQCVTSAAEHRHPEVMHRALYQLGILEIECEHVKAALQAVDELYDSATEHGDQRFVGRALHLLADLSEHPEQRAQLDERAHAYLEAAGDRPGIAESFRRQAKRASSQWDFDLAMRLTLKALAYFQADGLPHAVALCHNSLGELYRHLDRTDQAEASYRRSLELLDGLGDVDACYPRLNLGLIAMGHGRWLEAWHQLELGRQGVTRAGRATVLGVVHLLMLPCAAALGEWDAFDAHLARGRALREGKAPDRDVARYLVEAGDEAAEQSPERAREVYRLAALEWEALGRPEGVARARDRLLTLPRVT